MSSSACGASWPGSAQRAASPSVVTASPELGADGQPEERSEATAASPQTRVQTNRLMAGTTMAELENTTSTSQLRRVSSPHLSLNGAAGPVGRVWGVPQVRLVMAIRASGQLAGQPWSQAPAVPEQSAEGNMAACSSWERVVGDRGISHPIAGHWWGKWPPRRATSPRQLQ